MSKTPLNGGAFARVVMDLAAAVESQETRIKGLLLEAVKAGDLQLSRRILELWICNPVSAVIAQLEAAERIQHEGAGELPEEARDAGSGDVSRVDGKAGE